jgi:subtilase family serine protease
MLPARSATYYVSAACLLICLVLPASARLAFSQAVMHDHGPRIVAANIDETHLVTLKGNTHPLAIAKYDLGPVSDSMQLQNMLLVLKRSPEQQQAYETFLGEQQDPQSPNFHKWLTPVELGSEYGPSLQDIDTIERWLTYHGMQVESVSNSRMFMYVSGTAEQVREAFHTEIHAYNVKGVHHIANASDPQIPAALSPVLAGIMSLNDFMPKPALHLRAKAAFTYACGTTLSTECAGSGFNGETQYDETPADFRTIYDVPTPTNGESDTSYNGYGYTIAVVEDSDMQSTTSHGVTTFPDMTSFRDAFVTGTYTHGSFSQIHPAPAHGTNNCTDPGETADEYEAAVDSEWSYAVAPNATVELASCASTGTGTGTTFGAFIAATNLVDETVPPNIISMSYFQCESSIGTTGNTAIDTLWDDAAGEGISVFVAAGDGGAAGCDAYNSASDATGGIAVNGYASTPYDVAVGGTDFLDTSLGDNSTYWNTANGTNDVSAKSYIPETAWNDSCAGSVWYTYTYSSSETGLESCNNASSAFLLDIFSASGGPSGTYGKPSTFTGYGQNVWGNPNDSHRDLPDVSLFASDGFWNHAIVFCMSDANESGTSCTYTVPNDVFNNSGGGTSFTAPQLAGIQAIIDQNQGSSQGNVLVDYYHLYANEFGTRTTQSGTQATALANCNSSKSGGPASTCIFYDITSGNINVPCTGATDCYIGSGNTYGLLSTSSTTLSAAYATGSGWDFATGLGSINVTNLLSNWGTVVGGGFVRRNIRER